MKFIYQIVYTVLSVILILNFKTIIANIRMAHYLGDIVKYLKFDDTDIDNWIFKLYHKGCVIVFLVGSMVSIFSQYFGEPIRSQFQQPFFMQIV